MREKNENVFLARGQLGRLVFKRPVFESVPAAVACTLFYASDMITTMHDVPSKAFSFFRFQVRLLIEHVF